MITTRNAILVGLVCVSTTGSALAQTQPSFYRAMSLAPTDSATPGGGGPMDEAAQTAELAKELQNPVANLITAPIQNNWDFGIGPADAVRYTANIQPVIPFSLSEDWLVVTRTILPVIYAELPGKKEVHGVLEVNAAGVAPGASAVRGRRRPWIRRRTSR